MTSGISPRKNTCHFRTSSCVHCIPVGCAASCPVVTQNTCSPAPAAVAQLPFEAAGKNSFYGLVFVVPCRVHFRSCNVFTVHLDSFLSGPATGGAGCGRCVLTPSLALDATASSGTCTAFTPRAKLATRAWCLRPITCSDKQVALFRSTSHSLQKKAALAVLTRARCFLPCECCAKALSDWQRVPQTWHTQRSVAM